MEPHPHWLRGLVAVVLLFAVFTAYRIQTRISEQHARMRVFADRFEGTLHDHLQDNENLSNRIIRRIKELGSVDVPKMQRVEELRKSTLEVLHQIDYCYNEGSEPVGIEVLLSEGVADYYEQVASLCPEQSQLTALGQRAMEVASRYRKHFQRNPDKPCRYMDKLKLKSIVSRTERIALGYLGQHPIRNQNSQH